MIRKILLTGGMSLAIVLAFVTAGHAISVSATCNATVLANAVAAGAVGLVVTGATINSNLGAQACGTYTNVPNTYGIGPGIVLSSGNVTDYNTGPNTTGDKTTDWEQTATPAQNALLTPISGQDEHFDPVELTITFNMLPGFSTVFFNVVFGSEEFPEFVGSPFIDAFGLFLNGVNIATVGGLPVNINHPAMAAIPGTELDGVLAPGGNPVLLFSGLANPTGNTLKFILADTSDFILDTTVYISALGGTPPGPGVPEPSTVLLFATGFLGLFGSRRLRRTKVLVVR